ncbi:hypothetical protein [Pedobacter aquatilis]|uniref:hypothetical protein n=1 Tax=Pedobacter aquatilis TaxID=351343 RepID=UPI00293086EA|nr:hypothetical protein [Pedobacter aquatilis]
MSHIHHIFREIFQQEPITLSIPNWSTFSPETFIKSQGQQAPNHLQLAIAGRKDAQLHFYNDAFQSYYSNLVTSALQVNLWYSPMEAITKAFLKAGHPIQGINLYFLGTAERKKGKTYELLMKTAMAKAIDELYALNLERDALIRLICSTNENSVLDALFLGQIFPQVTIETEQTLQMLAGG